MAARAEAPQKAKTDNKILIIGHNHEELWDLIDNLAILSKNFQNVFIEVIGLRVGSSWDDVVKITRFHFPAIHPDATKDIIGGLFLTIDDKTIRSYLNFKDADKNLIRTTLCIHKLLATFHSLGLEVSFGDVRESKRNATETEIIEYFAEKIDPEKSTLVICGARHAQNLENTINEKTPNRAQSCTIFKKRSIAEAMIYAVQAYLLKPPFKSDQVFFLEDIEGVIQLEESKIFPDYVKQAFIDPNILRGLGYIENFNEKLKSEENLALRRELVQKGFEDFYSPDLEPKEEEISKMVETVARIEELEAQLKRLKDSLDKYRSPETTAKEQSATPALIKEINLPD